ncbi:helix-turn-helix domain-containing protein [Methylophilus sp. 'Pure River']|uniref:helix-turn-helix domain-containing protein n=1 Tax=Methylophilus sp. 'Pure River' TaxID=3377117 RepID=UPI00398EF30F
MSPFAAHLYQLRQRLKLSQRELAVRVGYEQGLISSLELDKKSPTDEFVEKLVRKFNLSLVEAEELRKLARVSQRKLVIPAQIPPETFHMLHRLWNALPELQSSEIRIVEELLTLREQRSLALKSVNGEEGRPKM